jgi:hypothetical protein
MAKERKAVDISDMPELLRLAEEVQATNEPYVLQREGKEIAAVVPLKPARRKERTKTEADYEAFRSSAGAWRDLVDTDRLIEDIYESRRILSRPPVEL